MTRADPARLEGHTVHARALGWDGSETDGTDWSLDRSDLPRLSTLVGVLVVNRVDALDYTQYVVNGVPVDPKSLSVADLGEFTLVAAGWENVPRDADGKWTAHAVATAVKVLTEAAPMTDDDVIVIDVADALNVSQSTADKLINSTQVKAAVKGQPADTPKFQDALDELISEEQSIADQTKTVVAKFSEQYKKGILTEAEYVKEMAYLVDAGYIDFNKAELEMGKQILSKSADTLLNAALAPHLGTGELAAIKSLSDAVAKGGLSEAEAAKTVVDLGMAAGVNQAKQLLATAKGSTKPSPSQVESAVKMMNTLAHPAVNYTEDELAQALVFSDPHINSIAEAKVILNSDEVTEAINAKTMYVPETKTAVNAKTMPGAAELVPSSIPYNHMTPGQKAAYTKKVQKAQAAWLNKNEGAAGPADPAPTPTAPPTPAPAHTVGDTGALEPPPDQLDNVLATHVLTGDIHDGAPPAPHIIQKASSEQVHAYLKSALSPKKYAAEIAKIEAKASSTGDADDLVRELGENVAFAHEQTVSQLKILGFNNPETIGGLEAQRALDRAKGLRKPTGGPSDVGTHVYYTDNDLKTLPRDKVEQILMHHMAGTVSPEGVKAWSDTDLRTVAIGQNKRYREAVQSLEAKGWTAGEIPHSAALAARMDDGFSNGFSNKAMQADGSPIGWNPQAVKVAQSGTVQNFNYGGTKVDAPHPSEWNYWGPGKKAAWTKKHKLGAAITKSKVKVYTGFGKQTVSDDGLHVTVSGDLDQARVYGNSHSFRSSVSEAEFEKDHYAWSNASDYEHRNAVADYTGSGYTPMNRYLRYGEYDTEANRARVNTMIEGFKTPAVKAAPTTLLRGKHLGPLAELNYNVGTTYTDKGFGSWTGNPNVAKSGLFGSLMSGASGRRVMTRVLNADRVRAIPGNSGEREYILPPGVTYKVVGIHDFVAVDANHTRFLDLEIVDAPAWAKVDGKW